MTNRGIRSFALLFAFTAGCGSIPAGGTDAADNPDPHDAADDGCPEGEVRCGEVCIDPDTDEAHCGASADCAGANAGEDCLDAYLCESGACVLQCDGTQVACGDECIEPSTSLEHCGASDPCDVDPGEQCVGDEICMGDHCEVPAAACALVGQYLVNSGPSWTTSPPTYTCREACALLYGGVSTDYACSTTSALPPTRQAYYEEYAVPNPCGLINTEDYKVGTLYNTTGMVSAYVQDHGCPDDINYCFTGACP